MKRQKDGVVNAYILNLMVHSDTLQLNEYEIRDRLQKRYKNKKGEKIRPQNVVKFHLEPLVKRHWLRLLPNKNYERVGELRHVNPKQTLHDQFEGFTEKEIDAIIDHLEMNRKMYGAEKYEDTLTEEQYKKYIENLINESTVIQ